MGSKLDLDKIVFSTGGGATNGAVTFARQGFRSLFMGKISKDPAGEAVLADLAKDDVDTSLVEYSDKYATGYSALLLAPTGERTILTYRGASTHYESKDFDLERISADWLFITSLAGSTEIVDKLVRIAKEKSMKIAMIPGKGELAKTRWLKSNLKHFDIFSLNMQEAQSLVEGKTIEELSQALAEKVGIAVVTDGPNGVAACDSKRICRAGMYDDVPVIDRTGAGDAFASGFTAAIARGENMEDAIVLGSANSTSVVEYIGAKDGILKKDVKLHAMDMRCHTIQK
jgi:sugar/nucleoside kinase (ribokinase family)